MRLSPKRRGLTGAAPGCQARMGPKWQREGGRWAGEWGEPCAGCSSEVLEEWQVARGQHGSQAAPCPGQMHEDGHCAGACSWILVGSTSEQTGSSSLGLESKAEGWEQEGIQEEVTLVTQPSRCRPCPRDTYCTQKRRGCRQTSLRAQREASLNGTWSMLLDWPDPVQLAHVTWAAPRSQRFVHGQCEPQRVSGRV